MGIVLLMGKLFLLAIILYTAVLSVFLVFGFTKNIYLSLLAGIIMGIAYVILNFSFAVSTRWSLVFLGILTPILIYLYFSLRKKN